MNKNLLQQIWCFALIGVVGYVVNAGIVEAIAPAKGPFAAQGLAFPVAVTVTWWLNRRYTFGASQRAIHYEWLRFVLANALGWIANNGAYVWMIFSFPLAYKHPALAVAVGSLAGMIFNFALSRQIVFKTPNHEENDMDNKKKSIYYSGLAGSGILSIYLFFYSQFNSNFSVLFGDPYDGVIEAVLIGHWYKVVGFIHHWNQPFFFYPLEDTLGYNDSYLIYGLLSLPFRLIGINILNTQEYVHILVKTIGFFSMVWLLNQITAKKSVINFFGAAIFILMINSSNQAGHGQLLSVAFSPLLFGIALKTITSISDRDNKFILWGALFSITYVAWLLTSFYMAWFFGLFCILVFLVALVLDCSSIKVRLRELAKNKKLQSVSLGILFLVCTAPFLFIYIPKLDQTGGHSYQMALSYSLKPWDVINIGPGSLIWGRVFELLSMEFPDIFRLGEYAVGFTPDILFSIAIFFALYLFSKKIKLTTLEFAVICAGVIGLFFPISINGWSLWWFIYHWVPGGSGVRVIARLWIFLTFPFAIAITVILHQLNSSHQHKVFSLFFVTILVIGQINTIPPMGLNVRSVLRFVDGLPPSPKDCKSFFMTMPDGIFSGDKSIDSQNFLNMLININSMLIADHINLPTINGHASFLPPGWDFSAPRENYLVRVHQYTKTHNIENICEYNMKNNSWKINPFSEQL
ncbi:MAG: GtrA family protein [Gammaproteobacteria bacterium]